MLIFMHFNCTSSNFLGAHFHLLAIQSSNFPFIPLDDTKLTSTPSIRHIQTFASPKRYGVVELQSFSPQTFVTCLSLVFNKKSPRMMGESFHFLFFHQP
jgi:hypothetical protein